MGVIITPDLKWETHIVNIVKRANSLLYLIKKSFSNLSLEMVRKIYLAYVRPKLEYAHCIWNPYYIKDIDMLERVQRRVTKMPAELRTLSYGERLRVFKLTTLRERRLRGDLIETFKILGGHYRCDIPIYHFSDNSHLRGHSQKLAKERCAKLARRNFLSNRIVYPWNQLDEETVASMTLNRFKNRLDHHMTTWNTALVHYT